MAKDLNGLNLQFAVAALKADQVLQAALVAAVVLAVVLVSTSSPTSSPIPAVTGTAAPPVSAPAPPAPMATPGTGTLFNPQPQPQAPKDKNQAPAPRIFEVKPGQSLDAVATPDKPADSSFGRSRETKKENVEVKQ
jgi:hypothetical protein